MPLSHVGLTVSHLPTSTSFFLSALQPLGYRYIGHLGNRIGLGVLEADFFLTQESQGLKAGTNHVVFIAPTRAAVDEFFERALIAGASPHRGPAICQSLGTYNASVSDLDGNNIEVMFQTEDWGCDGTFGYLLEKATLTGNELAGNFGRVMSLRDIPVTDEPETTNCRRSKYPIVPSSTALTTSSRLELALRRSLTSPASTTASDHKVQVSAKTLVGTILGAAAGAAVAYAMCKSEEDSDRQEDRWNHALAAQALEGKPKGFIAELSPIPPSDASQRSSKYANQNLRNPRGNQHLSELTLGRSLKAIDYVPACSGTKSATGGSGISRASVSRVSASRASKTRTARSESPDQRTQEKVLGKADSHCSKTSARAQSTYSKPHSNTRSKSSAPKSRSASSRADKAETTEEQGAPQCPLLLMPPDHKSFVQRHSDMETVLPSDSISCTGGRSRRFSDGRRSARSHSHAYTRSEAPLRSKRHSLISMTPVKNLPLLGWGGYDARFQGSRWRSVRTTMRSDMMSDPGNREKMGVGRTRERSIQSLRLPIRSRSYGWDPKLGHYYG